MIAQSNFFIRVERRILESGAWIDCNRGFQYAYGSYTSASNWIERQQKKYNYDFRIVNIKNTKTIEKMCDRPYQNKPYGELWYTLEDLEKLLTKVSNSYIDTTYCDAYKSEKLYRQQNKETQKKERFLRNIIERINFITNETRIEFKGYNLGRFVFCDGGEVKHFENINQFNGFYNSIREK